MKRQTMTSSAGTRDATRLVKQVGRSPSERGEAATARNGHAAGKVSPARPRQRQLRSVADWTHTLVLEGELTHRTAHALEVEIERLCEQGVTAITLDLSGLAAIDPVGVAVIAFRCGLCERRGYGFDLVRGSRRVQRAFTRAGVAGALPFREG